MQLHIKEVSLYEVCRKITDPTESALQAALEATKSKIISTRISIAKAAGRKQIGLKSQAYERHVLADKQHNFEKNLPKHLVHQADQALKDIYLFETLGLTQPVIEAEMEARMVEKIKDIMLEFGYGFTFIANQYRLVSPSGQETIIDLLFFNRRLRALVAVELKVGAFKPEYAGRMNYRLNLLDDLVKEPWENPSIGIILCSERDRIDVEYTLRGIDKPMGVAEFQLTPTLPQELTHKLPNPKELETEILKELGVFPKPNKNANKFFYHTIH